MVHDRSHRIEIIVVLRVDAARKRFFKLFGPSQRQRSFTCTSRRPSRAQSCILAPSDDHWRTRDPGRCECQSVNAGVSTHAWVMLDVPRKYGCLSSRFRFRRLVSDSDVPHRVVRIPHFGSESGRRTRADPRVVIGNWPRGRGAAAPPLRSKLSGCARRRGPASRAGR